MAADAEATLPALIEAVKSAIPNDHKAEIERRGEAAKKARAEGRAGLCSWPRLRGTQSPISTARLVMETWGQIKRPRFCRLFHRPATSATWPESASPRIEMTIIGSAGRRVWRWLWRSGLDWSGARHRDLGRFSVCDSVGR